jgi:hypothetical protein
MGAIMQLGLNITPELSFILNSAGNPNKTMSFSLDCFLIDIKTGMNIIYFR